MIFHICDYITHIESLYYNLIGHFKQSYLESVCIYIYQIIIITKLTRQVSLVIHSARLTFSPIANIVFAWNLFCFEKWGRTETYAKTMITIVGRPHGSTTFTIQQTAAPLSAIKFRASESIFGNITRKKSSLVPKGKEEDELSHRAVLVVNKRNVTRKFKTYTQLWRFVI